MGLSKRQKPDYIALAALALLAVVFWGNCLWGGKVPVAAIYQKQMLPWSAVSQATGETRQWDSLLWDSMAQFYPWRLLLHNAARQGELPLWNPYQFCGYPFVGNGQSAIFYPPNWLYFAIPPKLGMGLSAALHYFLGSLFVFGLARRWRLGTLSAAFAALAFIYGGFMVTWIELPTLVNSLIWLPLAWWGIEILICGDDLPEGPHAETYPASGPSRTISRGVIMLATALGMTLLAGHFQIAAYVWIFTALYGLVRLIALALAQEFRTTRRVTTAAMAAVALAGMLATVQLLPTLELGRYSARGAGGPSAAGFEFHRQRALQPVELLTLLQADFLGTPVDGTYRGISYSEHCPFVGATTLLLGLLGLALGWRRKHGRLRLWLFFGIAVFALWGAMAGPPAMLLYWGVPKLGQAGGFPRLLSVWTLAAALWGGAGLQVLLDRLAVSSVVGKRSRGLVPRRLRCSQITAGGVQAPALQKSGTTAAAVAALALLLLAAELLPWAHRFNPRADAATVYPETAGIRQLRAFAAETQYMAVNDRQKWTLLDAPRGVILPPNAATVYQVRSVDGYDSLFPLAYRQYAAQCEGADPSPPANGNMILTGNWRNWITPYTFVFPDDGERKLNGDMWVGDGLRLHHLGEQKYNGRAYRDFAMVGEHGEALPPKYRVMLPPTMLVDSCNQVRMDTLKPKGDSEPTAGEPGAVVLYDTMYPGWRAYVDGAERQIAAYSPNTAPRTQLFRRVKVGPQDRIVDFVYYPASVATGLFVSLLALAAVVGLGTSGLWRRRI